MADNEIESPIHWLVSPLLVYLLLLFIRVPPVTAKGLKVAMLTSNCVCTELSSLS